MFLSSCVKKLDITSTMSAQYIVKYYMYLIQFILSSFLLLFVQFTMSSTLCAMASYSFFATFSDFIVVNYSIFFQLEKWWEEKGYLELGIPMAPFMNLIGPGPYVNHFWPAQRGTQLERAGIILHYATKFWKLIRR